MNALIEKGADVNANETGYHLTPLLLACACARLQVIEVLLESKGINTKITDKGGANAGMQTANAEDKVAAEKVLNLLRAKRALTPVRMTNSAVLDWTLEKPTMSCERNPGLTERFKGKNCDDDLTGTSSHERRGSQTPTPQTIAAELVAAHRSGEAYSTTVEGSRGKGVLQLDAVAYSLLKVDSSELGSEQWAQPWHEELRRLGVSSGGTTGVIAILATPGLASSGKITRATLERYMTRLKALTPEVFQRWRTANRFAVDELVLVHLIIAHDPLFLGAEPQEARTERQLKRFQSIPVDAVTAWGIAAERPFQPVYEGQSVPVGWSGIYPAIDSAFELLRVDSLFVGDVFARDRFDSAMPIAKTLLPSRTAAQSAGATTPVAPPSDGNTMNSGALGSKSNPVRCERPSGEQQYLNRLRCANGRHPTYSRIGSFLGGPSSHILDGYKVKCEDSDEVTIFMDMYHSGYVEKQAVPGFTIETRNLSVP